MDNNKKKLLVLGATAGEISLVKRAKAFGIYVIVTDNHTDYTLSPAKYEAEKDKADVQMKKAKEYLEQALAINAADANSKKILDSINETLAK